MQAVAPQDHTATASSSALCKLITWHLDGVWQKVGGHLCPFSICCRLVGDWDQLWRHPWHIPWRRRGCSAISAPMCR